MSELKKALQQQEEKQKDFFEKQQKQKNDQQTMVDNDTTDYNQYNLFKTAPWDVSKPILSLPTNTNRLLFWIDKTKFDTLIAQKQQQDTTATPESVLAELFTISDNDDVILNVKLHEYLAQDVYFDMMEHRITYYMTQAKLLKFVGKQESTERVEQMVGYFSQLEKALEEDVKTRALTDMTSDNNDDTTTPTVTTPSAEELAQQWKLNQRIIALKENLKKTATTLGQQLSELNKMGDLSKFNNAQMASFLRTTSGTTKASRGLVDRNGDAIDFDKIIKEEIYKMLEYFPTFEEEMSQYEDKFNASFVSLSTTLDGLRALKELALTACDGEVYETKKMYHFPIC
eukprot:UN03334